MIPSGTREISFGLISRPPVLLFRCGDRSGAGKKANLGFSLLEILAVMAVMGLLIALSMPSLSGIQSGRSFAKSIADLSGILESARSYSQARNTYVWVGVAQKPNSPGRVYVAAMASLSGENNLEGEIEPQNQARELSGLALIPFAGADNKTQNIQASTLGTFTRKIGGNSVIFSHILCFNPTGEVIVQSGTVPNWIRIDCQEVRGTRVNVANGVSLQISGLSGVVSVTQNP